MCSAPEQKAVEHSNVDPKLVGDICVGTGAFLQIETLKIGSSV